MNKILLWIIRRLMAIIGKGVELCGLVHCPECQELLFVRATLYNEEFVACDKCGREWRVANNANDVYIFDWVNQKYPTAE